MKTQAWLQRLNKQLPGWKVWYTGTPGRGWCAVPAPIGTDLAEARGMPHRIGPCRTPQILRDAARERYADGDTCQTCNDDWRRCGHRQPETPFTSPPG